MPTQSLAEWIIFIAFIANVAAEILVAGPLTWYRMFALGQFLFAMIVAGIVVLRTE